MLYAIHMIDRPNSAALRAKTAEKHRQFVGNYLDAMYLGGPLLDDDETPIGSLIVMDFPNRLAAEEFIAAEPYNAAGLFDRVSINCFGPVVEPPHNDATNKPR